MNGIESLIILMFFLLGMPSLVMFILAMITVIKGRKGVAMGVTFIVLNVLFACFFYYLKDWILSTITQSPNGLIETVEMTAARFAALPMFLLEVVSAVTAVLSIFILPIDIKKLLGKSQESTKQETTKKENN